jgi:hypothetical protein
MLSEVSTQLQPVGRVNFSIIFSESITTTFAAVDPISIPIKNKIPPYVKSYDIPLVNPDIKYLLKTNENIIGGSSVKIPAAAICPYNIKSFDENSAKRTVRGFTSLEAANIKGNWY